MRAGRSGRSKRRLRGSVRLAHFHPVGDGSKVDGGRMRLWKLETAVLRNLIDTLVDWYYLNIWIFYLQKLDVLIAAQYENR